MAKTKEKLSELSVEELRKELAKAEKSKRENRSELYAGKHIAHKNYRSDRLRVAQIKTELAKRV